MCHFAGSLWRAGWMLPTHRSCRRGWGRRGKNRAAGFPIHIPGQTAAPRHAAGWWVEGGAQRMEGGHVLGRGTGTSKVLRGEP